MLTQTILSLTFFNSITVLVVTPWVAAGQVNQSSSHEIEQRSPYGRSHRDRADTKQLIGGETSIPELGTNTNCHLRYERRK